MSTVFISSVPFREATSPNLSDFYVVRDVIARQVSLHLIGDMDPKVREALVDMRAVLRAAYCIALAKGLPVRDLVDSALGWSKTVEAFTELHAWQARSMVQDRAEQASATERWGSERDETQPLEPLASIQYWRLDGTYDNGQDVLVALLATRSDAEARTLVARVGDGSELHRAIGSPRPEQLLDARLNFRLRYELEKHLVGCCCGGSNEAAIAEVEANDYEPTDVASDSPSIVSPESWVDITHVLLALLRLMGFSSEEGRAIIDDVAGEESLVLPPGRKRSEMIGRVYWSALRRLRTPSLPVAGASPISDHLLARSSQAALYSTVEQLVHHLLSLRDPRSRMIIIMKLRDGYNDSQIVAKVCVSQATVVRIITNFTLELEAAEIPHYQALGTWMGPG